MRCARSTADRLAIAAAVLRHLALERRCGGFFSTHYHDLTREVAAAPRLRSAVRLMHMQADVDAAARRVTFLYRLVPGVCPASHGMHVARMAGVARAVVERAERVGEQLALVAQFAGAARDLRANEQHAT